MKKKKSCLYVLNYLKLIKTNFHIFLWRGAGGPELLFRERTKFILYQIIAAPTQSFSKITFSHFFDYLNCFVIKYWHFPFRPALEHICTLH